MIKRLILDVLMEFERFTILLTDAKCKFWNNILHFYINKKLCDSTNVDGFYAARDNIMSPLPWKSIAPPITAESDEVISVYYIGDNSGMSIPSELLDAVDVGFSKNIHNDFSKGFHGFCALQHQWIGQHIAKGYRR